MDLKIFINVLLAVLVGFLAAHVAKRKGRPPTLWFVLGALFQFFTLCILLFLPDRRIKNEATETATKKIEPEKPPEKGWFYLDPERKTLGPVPTTTLQELFKENKLITSHFVWQEGMSDWKRLSDLPYLLECIQERKEKESASA